MAGKNDVTDVVESMSTDCFNYVRQSLKISLEDTLLVSFKVIELCYFFIKNIRLQCSHLIRAKQYPARTY